MEILKRVLTQLTIPNLPTASYITIKVRSRKRFPFETRFYIKKIMSYTINNNSLLSLDGLNFFSEFSSF